MVANTQWGKLKIFGQKKSRSLGFKSYQRHFNVLIDGKLEVPGSIPSRAFFNFLILRFIDS